MHHPSRLRFLPLVFAVALTAHAQSPSSNSGDDTLKLDRFVVSGVPVEDSVNPLTRDLSAVLGDSRNILDTPRGVSSITEALLNERGIHGVREFIVYSP